MDNLAAKLHYVEGSTTKVIQVDENGRHLLYGDEDIVSTSMET